MQITITACEGVSDRPMKLDVLGVKVEVSRLEPDKRIVIADKDGVVTVAVEEADSVVTEPEAVPEKAAPCPEDLFRKLVELRKKLAAEESLPAYTIFKDQTLKDMSEALPLDRVALESIKGVGDARLEKYGDAFLDVIQKHASG